MRQASSPFWSSSSWPLGAHIRLLHRAERPASSGPRSLTNTQQRDFPVPLFERNFDPSCKDNEALFTFSWTEFAFKIKIHFKVIFTNFPGVLQINQHLMVL